jgi:hypothetical protein
MTIKFKITEKGTTIGRKCDESSPPGGKILRLATILYAGIIKQQELYDSIIELSRTLDTPTIKTVLIALEEVIIKKASEGYILDLGFAMIAPVIQGDFSGSNPTNKDIEMGCSFSKELVESVRETDYSEVVISSKQPIIDGAGGDITRVIEKESGILTIIGSYLTGSQTTPITNPDNLGVRLSKSGSVEYKPNGYILAFPSKIISSFRNNDLIFRKNEFQNEFTINVYAQYHENGKIVKSVSNKRIRVELIFEINELNDTIGLFYTKEYYENTALTWDKPPFDMSLEFENSVLPPNTKFSFYVSLGKSEFDSKPVSNLKENLAYFNVYDNNFNNIASTVTNPENFNNITFSLQKNPIQAIEGSGKIVAISLSAEFGSKVFDMMRLFSTNFPYVILYEKVTAIINPT